MKMVTPIEGSEKRPYDGTTGMERTIFVPMKFNRLVLFRSWMWHAGGMDFGDNIENGRLVQLFFWQLSQVQGAPR